MKLYVLIFIIKLFFTFINRANCKKQEAQISTVQIQG